MYSLIDKRMDFFNDSVRMTQNSSLLLSVTTHSLIEPESWIIYGSHL